MLLRISILKPETIEERLYDIAYCSDILGFLRIYLSFEEDEIIRKLFDLVVKRLELQKDILKGLNYGKPI